MKKLLLYGFFTLLAGLTTAQTTLDMNVELRNDNRQDMTNSPIYINLRNFDFPTRSALVTYGGQEIPCQLDDLDGDGNFDELFLLTDIGGKKNKTLKVTLYAEGKPHVYPSQVYVEMMLSNKKIKETNKQDLYISQLTVDRGVNPYNMLHHHGAAFENDLVAYRIYFDHRQTVDIYGKYKKGLELRQTQFYPDDVQKAAGFGDDVLWVGSTFGLGTLRGWDGSNPTMINDVEHRGQRIIARGPLRTIVEVTDEQWLQDSSKGKPIDMTTRYTLYAGRRDCRVDVVFSRSVNDLRFATGIINVKNSVEHTDGHGLRGCWGTDWPVSAKDSVGHKRETVGLGIYLPEENVEQVLPADKDNYPFVVKVPGQLLTYYITFGSDNESFGYHSSKEWFAYLDEWKKMLALKPIGVKVTFDNRDQTTNP
ncbi:MAG: DUF4861 domain-containing protein [Prevotella sp.]|nr:DUF4861 domain-containing protein [Prevotella sp.]